MSENFSNKKELVSVPAKCTVADAVHTLANKDLDAVPVLADGKIVATFSSSDLCGIRHGELKNIMKMTVSQYLEQRASDRLQVNKGVCDGKSKLAAVLEKLVKFEIGRLWVVTGDNKFVGVVSIGDIISRLARYVE